MIGRTLPIGTRSLLWGGHQFVLHPLCVALAWWRLYGFPRDWRLWAVFFLHDIGYLGKRDLDGREGRYHPLLGAYFAYAYLGHEYGELCVGHSRTFANIINRPVSKLMRADKYATVLMPLPLYAALLWLSGEWREYLALHIAHGYTGRPTLLAWARDLRGDWRRRFGPGGAGV